MKFVVLCQKLPFLYLRAPYFKQTLLGCYANCWLPSEVKDRSLSPTSNFESIELDLELILVEGDDSFVDFAAIYLQHSLRHGFVT
jgi:hypothetical protein